MSSDQLCKFCFSRFKNFSRKIEMHRIRKYVNVFFKYILDIRHVLVFLTDCLLLAFDEKDFKFSLCSCVELVFAV